MNNIQNVDMNLQEIVKQISKMGYLIPKFQRDFVWNTKDIIDLGDSLIRGYPISSLLIMPENGSLKVGAQPLSKEETSKCLSNNIDESDTGFYVLDGQQRLTSMSKLFLNFDNKNEYYFDQLAILIDKFPHDNIQNDRGIKEYCLKSKVGDIFCRCFNLSKDFSEKPSRQHNRFISGKTILENRYGSIIARFVRVFKDANEDTIDKYTDHLSAVFGSLGGYCVPATIIASDSELGVVIRVFEKVNSTGRKLTLFDLINAKSFETKNDLYKVGLSDYLTNDLLRIIHDEPKLFDSTTLFFKFDVNKKVFYKLDKIARILEISTLLEKRSVPNILQSVMLEKEPEYWFSAWDSNRLNILEIISWCHEEGILNIGQSTFIEYAIAILVANKKAFKNNTFKNEIKKYALYLSISGQGFSKTNLDIVEKLSSISFQITNEHYSSKYEYSLPSRKPNITTEQVLEITSSMTQFKAIMNIFYIGKFNGKFTVDIAGTEIKNTNAMDNHHIFPKSRVKNFHTKSKFNSIANFILLDSLINREYIKDSTPKEYVENFKNLSTRYEFYFEQNLIDVNKLSTVDTELNAENFIQHRAELIAENINSYFE